MKKPLPLLVLPLLAAVTLASGGCVAAIGNREPARPAVSLGQQLIDLQKARESGALSDAEYQTQRDKFLAQK